MSWTIRAGKGTLLKQVEKENSNVVFSVSATTRAPREGEKDGVNYFYKSIDEFKEMIEKDELLEWVKYCDNYYGTPKKYIEDSVRAGLDVILEIEVEGALNIRNKISRQCFILFFLHHLKNLGAG